MSSTCKLFLCIPPRPQKQRVFLRKSTPQVGLETEEVNEERNIKPRRLEKNRIRPTSVVRRVPAPDPHTGLALFSCICCCLPFGFFAFIASMIAKKKIKEGDNVSAKRAAEVSYFCSAMSILSVIASSVAMFVMIFTLGTSK